MDSIPLSTVMSAATAMEKPAFYFNVIYVDRSSRTLLLTSFSLSLGELFQYGIYFSVPFLHQRLGWEIY